MKIDEPYVYDKAKYHYESVEQAGLPEEHASNHIVPMLRWLIDNDLMSDFFLTEGAEPLARYRSQELSIYGLFEWWDTCLISDMLSTQGNAFAIHYFDYTGGKYIQDYTATLQETLPSEFHVVYSDGTYEKLRPIIDGRYHEWLKRAPNPWWRFWR
jgi:hypothetical protein